MHFTLHCPFRAADRSIFLQNYAKTANQARRVWNLRERAFALYIRQTMLDNAPQQPGTGSMKRLFSALLFLLFLFEVAPAPAQLAQAKRLEFEQKPNGEEQYEVLTLGRRGMLLTYKRMDFYSSSPLFWRFVLYDTDLKVRWESELKIKFPLQPLLSYQNTDHLYWLYGEAESQKISILKLNLETGDQEIIDGELLAVDDVSEFRVLGNTAFVAGHYRDRAVVVRFDFFSRQSRVLPGMYLNRLSVSSLEVDEAAQHVNVIVTTSRRGKCRLTLRTYDYEGKLLRETPLAAEEGRTLLSGRVVPLGGGESLLVGNYSTNCSPYAQGVYVSQLDEAGQKGVRYLEFSQFKNFFNYLKPSRRQKVLDRIARKKEEGKEPKFRYLMLVHDLLPTEEGFLLVAEAFFPQYRTTPTGSFSAFSRGGLDRSLEGYRYTHALICGFDKSGKLLWDNCLAMPDRLSYELEEQVQITRQPDNKLVLAYPLEDRISTLVIRGGEVVEEKDDYELAPKDAPERIVSTENTTLAAWYGHYFLAWGTQRKGSLANSREVFYLEKLEYPVK